jgi:hypothetical protein
MGPNDPKKVENEQKQFKAEFEALVAIDAEWRKYFATQSGSNLKARPELPATENPCGQEIALAV